MKPAKKPIVRKHHTIDASDRPMGRLASEVATILRGKNKSTYEPHIDAGDFVNIKNISKIKFTGQKLSQKVYHSYSGYPGGLKTKKIAEVMANDRGEVLRRAVYQMLPPTRLRSGMMKRLTIQ
ncbi:50S ribosomal protein L13 [Candidatus Uhrbacteria bacterium]|nr:50S ribosomal protein L13 [Candidatus Uhrbacteria bacterium]